MLILKAVANDLRYQVVESLKAEDELTIRSGGSRRGAHHKDKHG
jgi:hypothetical protein